MRRILDCSSTDYVSTDPEQVRKPVFKFKANPELNNVKNGTWTISDLLHKKVSETERMNQSLAVASWLLSFVPKD